MDSQEVEVGLAVMTARVLA